MNDLRLERLKKQFKGLYGGAASVAVRSPGRVEIIGNHTDYNLGYALGAAISRETMGLFRARKDRVIEIMSNGWGKKPVRFGLDDLRRDEKFTWSNYARAVVKELVAEGDEIGGAEILLDSTVPVGGGVSSSAALELVVARGLLELYGRFEPMKASLICQRAENGPLVKSPCGLLDQVTIAFGEKDKMVLIDFKPKGGLAMGVELIPASLGDGVSWVLVVDEKIKRSLGESGYPARRKQCEQSWQWLEKWLGKKVESLRDISVKEFEKVREKLEAKDRKMRMRVEHVVYENQRVLEAVKSLRKREVKKLGELLTSSGKSALQLYELDEKTPELSYLVNEGKKIRGVVGMRNMGGGFAAVGLALVEDKELAGFKKELGEGYAKKFKGKLKFIEFEITKGVEVLAL